MSKNKAKILVGALVEFDNGARLHVVHVNHDPSYPEDDTWLVSLRTADEWQKDAGMLAADLPDDSERTYRTDSTQVVLVPAPIQALPLLADGMLTTATCPEEVMWWIETHDHGCASGLAGKYNPPSAPGGSDGQYMMLSRGAASARAPMLRVPRHIWKQCYVRPGGEHDARMYRWDHAAAARAFRNQSSKYSPTVPLAPWCIRWYNWLTA